MAVSSYSPGPSASVTRMDRAARLDAVLVALTRPDPRSEAADALRSPAADDGFVWALRSLVQHWTGDFVGAVESVRCGRAAGDTDADARALLAATAGLALSASVNAPREWWDVLREGQTMMGLSEALRDPLVALLAEAAVACAQLTAVHPAIEASATSQTLFGRTDHPFLTVVRCSHARLLLFTGDLRRAEAAAAAAVAASGPGLESAFARACGAVTAGNADRRAITRAAVRDLSSIGVTREHLLSAGVHLLAAYAASAQGDITAAATLALSAGGDAELSGIRIIDRVFCLELFVSAALEQGDLDVAEAWSARAEPLVDHPVADSTVSRIGSRVALARGDAPHALKLAEQSIAQARAQGRELEASDGEILAARARIAMHRGGEAARRLDQVVSDAEQRGHGAVRLAAARELRRVGRRLAPDPTSGWEGLSEREREVAVLVGRGESNADIAEALFLSVHTVRVHVSRILQAFGVATRVALAARLTGSDASFRDSSDLTARQLEVARLVAGGATNARIAQELGIGISTVEKHISAILRAWNLPSRAAVAAQLGPEETGAVNSRR